MSHEGRVMSNEHYKPDGCVFPGLALGTRYPARTVLLPYSGTR
jgi:hypothetical protein